MPFSMGSALLTEQEVAERGGLAKGEGKDPDGHESGSPTPTQSRSGTPTPVTARELMEMDFKTRPDVSIPYTYRGQTSRILYTAKSMV